MVNIFARSVDRARGIAPRRWIVMSSLVLLAVGVLFTQHGHETNGTAPTIDSIEPASGPIGQSVSIVGARLLKAKAVRFGSTSAATFTVESATRIRAVVARGTTTGAVSIASHKGTTSPGANFTVTPKLVPVHLRGRPEDTRTGVHVGLTGTFGITRCCGALLKVTPAVREVWNWGTSFGQSSDTGTRHRRQSPYAKIFKGMYFPVDRQPDFRFTPGTKSLSWFERHHPDWIEYRCDRTSTAYAFGERYGLPLDASNPAVLSWLERTFYGPAAASGDYQALDFDNFTMENGGGWSGYRCGHYTTGHAWVQQYNGTNNDPNYRTYEINLAKHLQSWLHRNYPMVALEANFSLDLSFPGSSQLLMSHVDILFDEQGYTHGNNGPGEYVDSAWLAKTQTLGVYLEGNHGWQDVNQEPVTFTSTTQAQRQWAIANYLLVKNNASWMYICGHQQYGTLLIAPEYAAAQVGTPQGLYYADQGVYRRDFTHGLVFVNPSSTTSHTVTIPASTYKNLYGTVQPGSIVLSPGTAIVLVHV